jgi:RecJ-like exonuclease
VAGTKITSNKRSPRVKPTTRTTIDRLPHEDLGDMVMVAGVVAVEPGVLGSQYFYIVDPTVSTTTLPGIQIYSYKKDFPKLQRGDRIEVVGELSEASGELRIKTAEAASMRVIGHVGDPTPLSVDIAAIGEPLEGSFVRVHGEVTEIKGSYMYLDDGTGEIKVYFKSATGINKKLVALGDLAEVRGLIHQTKTDYQLLPRSQKDIIKTGVTEEVVAFQQEQEKNEGKEVAEKYLTATAGGLTSILFGLFAKSKGGKIKTLLKKIWLIALLFFRRRKNK